MRKTALCLALLWPVTLWPMGAGAVSPFTDEQAAAMQAGLIVTADDFILPAYEAQALAAEGLTETLNAYCAGEAPIEPAYDAFAETFLAWQRAGIVQIGPVMDAEGPMRVQLWPDPKGHSSRAARRAVSQADPSMLEEGGLKGRSIALTNLTTLESVLYGDLAPGTYACGLAEAIADFQANLGDDLVAGWSEGSEFRALYDTAADGNELFPNVDSLARELLAGPVAFTDRLRRFKLGRGLGEATGDARPERTEAQQSGLGLASIAASFQALADFYAVPGGLFDVAPGIGGSSEHTALANVAASIAERVDALTVSLTDIAAEDGEEASRLRRYGSLVGFQQEFLKVGFLGPLGLSAGFTTADGD